MRRTNNDGSFKAPRTAAAMVTVLSVDEAIKRLNSSLYTFSKKDIIRVKPYSALCKFVLIDLPDGESGELFGQIDDRTKKNQRIFRDEYVVLLRKWLENMAYEVIQITISEDYPDASFEDVIEGEYDDDVSKAPFTREVYEYNYGWYFIAEIAF